MDKGHGHGEVAGEAATVATVATKWIILRTQGRRTLALAQSLREDGFDVWTPEETRMIRKPRLNAKREVQLPMLPSYVFARAEDLVELLQLAAMPVKPRRGAGLRQPAHPDFSVTHTPRGIPMVADHDLAALRRIEARRPKRKAEKAFEPGHQVRVGGGSFGGMSGRVEKSDRGITMVCFDGGLLRRVKLPTSILSLDDVRHAQSAASEAA
jgi:transcription antitermination factor NusG